MHVVSIRKGYSCMSYYGLTKLHKLLPIPKAHLLTTEITSLKTTVC